MKKNNSDFVTLFCLFIITFIGFYLRYTACKWGLPYPLHPDEMLAIRNSFDLINRDSFSPMVFNHPDHFQIKAYAIIYIIYSSITGIPIKEFITERTSDCIFFARLFSTCCGTLLIPLSYIIMEKIKQNSGLFAAFFCAFLPVFVQHSAYATPDIPITLMFFIFIFFSLKYLENNTIKYLVLMCCFIGLSITIKYPGAILLLPAEICITIVACRRKNFNYFLKYSFFTFFGSLLFTYIFSPTLFLELPKVITTLKLESRSNHLGHDSLGFFGNLLYYGQNFIEYVGIEFVILILIGLFFCIKSKNLKLITINFGWIFIICISLLPLHWERWYLPGLISPLFIAALGITSAFENLKKYRKSWTLLSLLFILVLIPSINMFLDSFIVAKRSVGKQSVLVALDFCNKHNITKLNSDFEGYTPFSIGRPHFLSIQVQNDNLVFPDNIDYILLAKSMYSRFYSERNSYQWQVKRYDLIKKSMKRIAKFKDHTFTPSILGIKNIFRMMSYLKKFAHNENLTVGDTIVIFKKK